MNRTERFYKIDQMLHERGAVSIETFLSELDISRATFKRDMEYLRDRLHAPIIWDRDAGGYRFDKASSVGPAYELPGLWFSSGELYSLLAAYKLLGDMEPGGVLSSHVAPLQSRLAGLLESNGHSADEITKRFRLLSMAKRPVEPKFFNDITSALLERKRLELDAYNRERDETNTRIVSPQRLVHYRDNWYLDAWCHWRNGLRSFSVDTILQIKTLSEKALDISDSKLEEHYAAAYGIFAGSPKAWAVLRFSPERARWVRSENWHREQKAEELPDGSYRLSVPYSSEKEIAMDILRHGSHVVIESPKSLRQFVRNEAVALASLYQCE